MAVDLRSLKPAPGSVRSRKRIGRGPGSGLGKTSGRGQKGAGARAGKVTPTGFEGGQMPLQRRLPKRGFRNPFRRRYTVVSVGRLETVFEAGSVVDVEALQKAGLVRRSVPVKVLGDGEIARALTVRVHAVSGSAREKITSAGGSVEIVE